MIILQKGTQKDTTKKRIQDSPLSNLNHAEVEDPNFDQSEDYFESDEEFEDKLPSLTDYEQVKAKSRILYLGFNVFISRLDLFRKTH